MNNVKNIIKSYEEFVSKNPDIITDLETTIKWVSYFIAGRISDSNILSESVYSLSNMLVLYNDRILDKTKNPNIENEEGQHSNNSMCYRLKVMLTTLEYSEVFVEISANRLFGKKGKWFFVVIIQLFKLSARYFILKYSSERIVTSPAVPVLNRRALISKKKKLTTKSVPRPNQEVHKEHSLTFELKRSGRVVRKVEGAPPLQYREFKLQSENDSNYKSDLHGALLKAEYLYIAKPVIHLAAMGLFGEKNWKQYFVALAIDLLSIRQYHKNRHLMTKEQNLEMSRRCVNLLLYLMRSPLYERFTQSRLDRVLDFIANNIPLVRMVAAPLRDYIPHWQSTYFYLWST